MCFHTTCNERAREDGATHKNSARAHLVQVTTRLGRNHLAALGTFHRVVVVLGLLLAGVVAVAPVLQAVLFAASRGTHKRQEVSLIARFQATVRANAKLSSNSRGQANVAGAVARLPGETGTKPSSTTRRALLGRTTCGAAVDIKLLPSEQANRNTPPWPAPAGHSRR